MSDQIVSPKRNLVLFDIDGVVADDTHRVPYAIEKDWGMYFELASKDKPFPQGLSMTKQLAVLPDYEVQYLTGRRLDMYNQTSAWLREHGFPCFEFITMRGFAHRDRLAEFKAGVINSAINSKRWATVHLIEDDPAVVQHVNEVYGSTTATLVPWSTKAPEMVKYATA